MHPQHAYNMESRAKSCHEELVLFIRTCSPHPPHYVCQIIGADTPHAPVLVFVGQWVCYVLVWGGRDGGGFKVFQWYG